MQRSFILPVFAAVGIVILTPWTSARAQTPDSGVLLTPAEVDQVTGRLGTYSDPRRLKCCEDFALFTADSTKFVMGRFLPPSDYQTLIDFQSYTPILGVGDDASWNQGSGVLAFRKGSRVVALWIVLNPADRQPTTLAQLTALARIIASRLSHW